MLAVETLSSSVGSCKRSPQGTNNCICPKNVPMSITKPGSHSHLHTYANLQQQKKTNKQWFRVCATLTDGSQNTVLQQPITIIEIPGSWEMIGQGPVWLRPTQNTVFRVFIRDFVQSLNRHQSLEVHFIGNTLLSNKIELNVSAERHRTAVRTQRLQSTSYNRSSSSDSSRSKW